MHDQWKKNHKLNLSFIFSVSNTDFSEVLTVQEEEEKKQKEKFKESSEWLELGFLPRKRPILISPALHLGENDEAAQLVGRKRRPMGAPIIDGCLCGDSGHFVFEFPSGISAAPCRMHRIQINSWVTPTSQSALM